MVKTDLTLSVNDVQQLCAETFLGITALCSDDTGDGISCHDGGEQQQIDVQCATQEHVCNYTLMAETCNAGYYCPRKTVRYSCEPGFYCPAGSVSRLPCTLGRIGCPDSGMEYPNSDSVFIVLFVIFVCALLVQSYLAKKVLQNKEKILSDATSEESHQLSQQQEGEAYKKTLIALAEQISDRPNMKMSSQHSLVKGRAGVRHLLSGRQNSEEESARARATWHRFIRSRSFRDYVQMMRDRENNLVNTMTGSFSFKKVGNPLTIAFDHLDLNLMTNGAPILRDIFGCFRPFNITALMGSSGAGKTTLLSLLRGKAHFAVTSGEIRVNGVTTPSLVPFADVMAYVPQDDIMYDELTVSENLRYSCLLFNRRGYTTSNEIVPMVHHTMELLGLSFIKHSVVGSPEEKGISGGQKKRVSIGMELMKEPSLFFLDEPTSGLDSASSISLVNSLRKISQNGVNIVATLHQPRIEIFDLINVLYLLATGGRVAYFGPAFGLNLHMKKLGFICPASSNISDYVMDVISGFVAPAWNAQANAQETVTHICDYTYAEQHDEFQKEMRNFVRGTNEVVDESLKKMKTKTFGKRLLDILVLRCHTFSISFRRQMKIYYRAVVTSIVPYVVLVMMGILIANLFGTVELSSKTLPSQVMSAQLAYAITIQPAALKLFLSDSLMRTREADGGVTLLPLYLGKLFGHMVEFIVSPMAFVCGYYPFIKAIGGILEYYSVFLLLTLAVTGLTNMCVVLFGKRAGTMSSGLLIILWAVGGIEPTVSVIFSRLKGFGRFLVAISLFRKTYEMGLLVELRRYSDVYADTVNSMYTTYDISESRYGRDAGYLILYWAITNLIAVFCMVWMRDNYRYWRIFLEVYFWPSVDVILTTDCFKAIEGMVTATIAFFESLDSYIAVVFINIEKSLRQENIEVETCDLFLQYLLAAEAENTLDSLCKECLKPIREHKRQKAKQEVMTWSSGAIQRRAQNASFISHSEKRTIMMHTIGVGDSTVFSPKEEIGKDRMFILLEPGEERDVEGDVELGDAK